MAVTDPPIGPTSLRDYARHRGISAAAVSKAVRDGRLVESVVLVDGQPKIADIDVADREWEANTRPNAEQRALAPSPEQLALLASRAAREAMGLRRDTAEAKLAELELAEREGQLIDRDQALADVNKEYSLVKTRLLAIASQVAQQMPELADQVVPVIDRLIREALEELSLAGDPSGG